MKTTGVSGIPKFGLLDFLGHPIVDLALTTFKLCHQQKGKQEVSEAAFAEQG